MKEKSVKLSFIIPAFNVEKTIKRTVLSILNQGLKDYEIIIVDDCSKDETAQVVGELAKENDVIRYFKQEKNSGPGAARNRGISEARGEFIEFVDGDDYLKDNSIPKALERIEKEKADLLIFGFEAIGYRSTTHFAFKEGVYSRDEFLNLLKESFISGIFNSCFNKIYRKERIKKDFPTSTFIGEDVAFNADNLVNYQKICVISDECYMYDSTQASLMRSHYKFSLEKIDFMCEKCISAFKECGLSDEDMSFIYYYYASNILDDFIFSKEYKKNFAEFKKIVERYERVFKLGTLYALSSDEIINLVASKKLRAAFNKIKNRGFKKKTKALLKKMLYGI